MFSPKRRSVLVATAAVFAGLVATLGLIPISKLVGIVGFITFRSMFSPVAGMLLGPITGGLSVVVGVFLDIALGKPLVFLGLDFLPDLAAAVTAGLCFSGRRTLGILIPCAVVAALLLGPASPLAVFFWGIPFVWMHLLSIAILAGSLYLERRGRFGRLSWAFVAPVMFASTMS
ncbi:MAG: hypothetical protein HY297_04070, partial [Thaumarchaeota archaeon]|nr:hypothetical protein [Nitrososphaerota archaeon]